MFIYQNNGRKCCLWAHELSYLIFLVINMYGSPLMEGALNLIFLKQSLVTPMICAMIAPVAAFRQGSILHNGMLLSC